MPSPGQRIAVTLLTLLAGSAHCFRATLYSSMDCQGETQDAWIYDNTCSWRNGFQSFKVYEYGGTEQWATFYSTGGCLPTGEIMGGWVYNTTNALIIPGTQIAEAVTIGTQGSYPVTQVNKYLATEAKCYNTVNDAGGANAIGSRYIGKD